MTLFTGLFVWGSEADGSSVSRQELERLHRADRKAVLIARFKPEEELTGMQLEEQHRADRIRHIEARLRSAEGHAKADFAAATTSGKAGADFDHER